MIPADSLVPPLKPADMAGSNDNHHHGHSEHSMNPSAGNLNKICFSFLSNA
jgi:hypothetical protein